MGRIDYTGQVINGAKINHQITDYISPAGHRQARYNCTCMICDKEFDVNISCFKRNSLPGCGCVAKRNKKKKRNYYIKNVANQRFGHCVAKERLLNGNWECLCDCGRTFETSLSHLTTGHTKSCGCLRSETSKSKRAEISGQKFGKLTAVKYEYSQLHPNGRSSAMWLCLCECGSYTIVSAQELSSGHTRSCGCLSASKRELEIRKWLTEKTVKYTTEYSFDDLYIKRSLRYDFALLDNDNNLICLIEHYGIQHYSDNSSIDFGKQQREITDKMKQSYCANHAIPLYVINYNDDINDSLSKIMIEMHVNTVPSLQEIA